MSKKGAEHSWYERIMVIMSSTLNQLERILNDDTVKCKETIGTVERDVEDKQLEMEKMKERVGRLRTIIQQKKNHLSHLKRLNKRK